MANTAGRLFILNLSKPDLWVTHLKRNPHARLRLFCFPYAGGGALVFRTWPESLPPEIEVCPVQLPGRENRLSEPPFTKLLPLVEKLAEVLCPYFDIPFCFFGHSMGGLISFELARHLRRQNAPAPVHLFVSGRTAPQLPDRDRMISHLPEPEFLEELRGLNGTPEGILQNAEFRELILPILRGDFAICETYEYTIEKPLACPISVFGGVEDGKVYRDDLEAWRNQTCGAFNLQMLPGDHFFLHSTRPLLLRAITRDLMRLLRRMPNVRYS